MIRGDSISDEKLNALLDNELDSEERAQILSIMQNNSGVANRYSELRRVKESIITAYDSPPLNSAVVNVSTLHKKQKFSVAVASAGLLLIGSAVGWVGGTLLTDNKPSTFYNVAQLSSSLFNDNNILIHINTMDPDQVNLALEAAERLLQAEHNSGKVFKIEIVTNAGGLGILRQSSPYAELIQELASNYHNISFKACGVAKRTASLNEGREIQLLPQAEDIPAALDLILRRLKDGWIYVKG